MVEYKPLQILFRFHTSLLGNKRFAPLVIKGSREWIEEYIPLSEFAEVFGGYALWREPDTQSDAMPGEGLGVWGNRNVSKLQRILRERGADFETVDGEGPRQEIAIRSTS